MYEVVTKEMERLKLLQFVDVTVQVEQQNEIENLRMQNAQLTEQLHAGRYEREDW